MVYNARSAPVYTNSTSTKVQTEHDHGGGKLSRTVVNVFSNVGYPGVGKWEIHHSQIHQILGVGYAGERSRKTKQNISRHFCVHSDYAETTAHQTAVSR